MGVKVSLEPMDPTEQQPAQGLEALSSLLFLSTLPPVAERVLGELAVSQRQTHIFEMCGGADLVVL